MWLNRSLGEWISISEIVLIEKINTIHVTIKWISSERNLLTAHKTKVCFVTDKINVFKCLFWAYFLAMDSSPFEGKCTDLFSQSTLCTTLAFSFN